MLLLHRFRGGSHTEINALYIVYFAHCGLVVACFTQNTLCAAQKLFIVRKAHCLLYNVQRPGAVADLFIRAGQEQS